MSLRRNNLTNCFTISVGIAAAILASACSDPVGPSELEPVARVNVVAPMPALTVGATMKLRAEPRDGQGVLLKDRTVRWTSGDTSVATVDQAGVVTARRVGAAVIAARVDGRVGQTTISVSATPDPGSPALELVIGASPARTLDGNRTEQLFANLIAPGGLVVAIFPHSPAGHAITWTSSDSSVVRVSPEGEITTGWAGTAKISAESAGSRAELVVHVRSVVTRVLVTPESYGMLGVGASVQLTAIASPATLAPTARPVTWSSSNERVATVDAHGVVTGRKAGWAIIYAAVEGVVGRYAVEVAGDVEQPLEAAAGNALPAVIHTSVVTDGSGTRVQRVIATGGSFRMAKESRWGHPQSYVLRLSLRVEEQGQLVRTIEYLDEGQVFYDWRGIPMFESTKHPNLRFTVEELTEETHWRTGEIEMEYAVAGYEKVMLRFGKP